jgi:hypothetical protein
MLTLYTTPVIYLYMVRLGDRFRHRKAAAALPLEPSRGHEG